MTAARSGTHTAPLAVPMGGKVAIPWQGASLDGQHIFRLINGSDGWVPEYVLITAPTLTFKPVATVPLFLDFCVALAMAYAQLAAQLESIRGGKQVIPTPSDINDVTGNGVTATQPVTNGRRSRGKVSGGRAT